MKYSTLMNRFCVAVAFMAAATLASTTFAQTVIWQDDDPGYMDDGMGNRTNGEFTVPSDVSLPDFGLTITEFDGNTVTGDASRAIVGGVTMPDNTGATAQLFQNFNSTTLPLDPSLQGSNFTYSIDYFVPNDTTLDNPTGESADLFYIQINFDGVNSGSAGFVGEGAAGTGWQTATVSGTIPATATEFLAFGLIVDGGFGGSPANADGTGVALYVDNILITAGEESIGDFNSDENVDGTDFILWQQRFMNPPPFNPILETDAQDLVDWNDNYGTMAPAISAVPEPTSLVLCLLGGVAALASSRRRSC